MIITGNAKYSKRPLVLAAFLAGTVLGLPAAAFDLSGGVDVSIGGGGIDANVGVGVGGTQVGANVGVGTGGSGGTGANAGVCVGTCGGTTGTGVGVNVAVGTPGTGTPGTGGPGIPGIDLWPTTWPQMPVTIPPAQRRADACDNGSGNSEMLDGTQVLSSDGYVIGWVQDAVVGPNARVQQIRMQSNSATVGRSSCFTIAEGLRPTPSGLRASVLLEDVRR